MYYRIVDDYWTPYPVCYNEKHLTCVAKWIYTLEPDFFDENNCNEKKILNRLYRWLWNIWGYNVQKSTKPFNEEDLNFIY